MKIIGKNNLHDQKRMMFAGTEIVILSAVLSHQLVSQKAFGLCGDLERVMDWFRVLLQIFYA